jgi:hypothetical protein
MNFTNKFAGGKPKLYLKEHNVATNNKTCKLHLNLITHHQFSFHIVILQYILNCSRELPRSQWPNNDPTLIAEGVFAVANVFSFARIIYLFQTNPHLGPLQISLGCMIIGTETRTLAKTSRSNLNLHLRALFVISTRRYCQVPVHFLPGANKLRLRLEPTLLVLRLHRGTLQAETQWTDGMSDEFRCIHDVSILIFIIQEM